LTIEMADTETDVNIEFDERDIAFDGMDDEEQSRAATAAASSSAAGERTKKVKGRGTREPSSSDDSMQTGTFEGLRVDDPNGPCRCTLLVRHGTRCRGPLISLGGGARKSTLFAEQGDDGGGRGV